VSAMPEPAETAEAPPPTLRWAVRLLAAQAIAVAVLFALVLYADLTREAQSVRGALLVNIFTAMMAVLLGGLARALHRRRAWARSPAIVLELLLLPIGYYLVTGGVAWLGLPVIAVGLAGAAALLAPATRVALGLDRGAGLDGGAGA
jgi:hypothetical protein